MPVNILYIILTIIIIILIYYSLQTDFFKNSNNKLKNILKFKKVNQCNKELTDEEFLHHMIKHHEVAVYMSEQHLNNTHDPIIFKILRNIIRIQKYEINTMKDAIIVNKFNDDFNDDMSDNKIKMNKLYYSTNGDFAKPNTLEISNTICDPSFFNIMPNLHHMTDEMYIQHMIPHHQVAVDMSKKILNTSNNDFIIYLAYRIIRSQQLEIHELYNLLNSNYKINSKIL